MTKEEEILKTCHTVAIVGLSSNSERYSHKVASYLKEQGYRIVPVNPQEKSVLGQPCYPDLASIPEPIDVVDIFRRSEEVPAIVEQAIKARARVVWMQKGVINEEAAALAKRAGLIVVMDKCMREEHLKLTGKS